MDCWIAKAKPGSKKNKYPRLKSRKPIFDGKKTEYLSIHGSALAEAEDAIARGRTIKKLNKQIKALNDRIEKLTRKSSQKQQSATEQSPPKRYLPPPYLNLVRQVLGEIDLDPVSDEVAQQWVQAATYYTLEQNGLSHPWFGRVWLHPPVPGKAGKWIKKAIAEYEAGHITDAIILVKASPGSKWFQKLVRLCPVCFPDERIRFWDEQGQAQDKPRHGNAFFYLGRQVDDFKQVFSSIGSVSSPL